MKKLLLLLIPLTLLQAQQGLRSPAYVAQLQKVAAGGGGSYDPASDTDIKRWWRAEGTVGTNAVNGSVTNWAERKGGFPFTNLTDLAAGPILTNNYVNGKAALRGFGTNVLDMKFGNFSSYTEAHFFVVIRAGSATNVNNNGFWKGNGNSGLNVYHTLNDGQFYNSMGTTVRKNAGLSMSIENVWRLLEVVSKSGTWTLRLDGVDQYTTGSNSVGWDAAATENLFANEGVSESPIAQGFVGDIAEILFSDVEKTGSGLTDVRTYLDDEYNLAY